MKKIKLWKEMKNTEKRRFLQKWVKYYQDKSEPYYKDELMIAIKLLKNDNLEDASEYLSKISNRSLSKIYEKFETLIQNLQMEDNLQMYNIIKELFKIKSYRQLMALLNQSIKEGKIELNDEEKKIIYEFGREYT